MLEKSCLALLFFFVNTSLSDTIINSIPLEKKPHTIGIFIAANNDLASYATRSIKQMLQLDDNQHVNILILHAKKHRKKLSNASLSNYEAYSAINQYVEVSAIIAGQKQLLYTVQGSEADSGNEQLLIDFYTHIAHYFPAENYHLFFWDHGTGPLEPFFRKQLLTRSLFRIGNIKNREDSEPLNFLTILLKNTRQTKGLCYDHETNKCLTEKGLKKALSYLTESVIKQKFSIIGFDMCFMSMIEIAYTIKDYANFMVGSQEAELGEGWDYSSLLKIFKEKNPTPRELALHIVNEYVKTFSYISYYTLTALDLIEFNAAITNLEACTKLILYGLKYQESNSFFNALELSRSKKKCTHFDEADFIDLLNFLYNLGNQIKTIKINDENRTAFFQKELAQQITNAIRTIENSIIINKSGKKFKKALGLSIYFPAQQIHGSYHNNEFATKTYWLEILKTYHQHTQ